MVKMVLPKCALQPPKSMICKISRHTTPNCCILPYAMVCWVQEPLLQSDQLLKHSELGVKSFHGQLVRLAGHQEHNLLEPQLHKFNMFAKCSISAATSVHPMKMNRKCVPAWLSSDAPLAKGAPSGCYGCPKRS